MLYFRIFNGFVSIRFPIFSGAIALVSAVIIETKVRSSIPVRKKKHRWIWNGRTKIVSRSWRKYNGEDWRGSTRRKKTATDHRFPGRWRTKRIYRTIEDGYFVGLEEDRAREDWRWFHGNRKRTGWYSWNNGRYRRMKKEERSLISGWRTTSGRWKVQ